MKPVEIAIIIGLDIVAIMWLVIAFIDFTVRVVADNKSALYWKKRTNLTNAAIGFVIVAGINAIVL